MNSAGFLVLAGLQFDFTTLPQQLVNGLFLGSIYALIALGYTMVYGVLRLINFAHGDVYMLGAYFALFTSYHLGYYPGSPILDPKNAVQANPANLVLMIMVSMLACGLVGLVIERFAYRPMRRHSRIASLITAIGVSLLLEFGGPVVLPVSPPPSINSKVSFIEGSYTVTVLPAPSQYTTKAAALKPAFEAADQAYKEHLKASKEDPFNLSPTGKALRDTAQKTEREYSNVIRDISSKSTTLQIQKGQLTMFVTALILMAVLSVLVMKTKTGRAMRAISLDFDSAALMGINVDKVITWTFFIGSALAGAGAMMNATFIGTPLTATYGLQPGVKAFVAAVLGGIGNIPGAMLGGILMGIAETLVIWLGYSSYKDAVAFVILIIVLLVRPGGLLGSSKVEKV